MQSMASSAAPSDVSKGEIGDIKEELTLLLEDEANDAMGYEGQCPQISVVTAAETSV